MKNLLAAAAASALALTAAPALADHHAGSDGIMLNADQKAMMEAWPADRKQTYMNWPEEAQAYYWTLSEQQKMGWWQLNDTQRVQIVGMNAEDRATAWRTIASQMGGATTTAMPATTAAATTQGSVRFVSREMAQAPKKAAVTGDLPVCTPNQQDGCINSWAKNKTGTRPLGYWPGRPASEM